MHKQFLLAVSFLGLHVSVHGAELESITFQPEKSVVAALVSASGEFRLQLGDECQDKKEVLIRKDMTLTEIGDLLNATRTLSTDRTRYPFCVVVYGNGVVTPSFGWDRCGNPATFWRLQPIESFRIKEDEERGRRQLKDDAQLLNLLRCDTNRFWFGLKKEEYAHWYCYNCCSDVSLNDVLILSIKMYGTYTDRDGIIHH